MTLVEYVIVAAFLVGALFTWCLCRMAALSDSELERELSRRRDRDAS